MKKYRGYGRRKTNSVLSPAFASDGRRRGEPRTKAEHSGKGNIPCHWGRFALKKVGKDVAPSVVNGVKKVLLQLCSLYHHIN